MTYNNCVKQVLSELGALPPVWAEKLACNICNLVTTEDECNPTDLECEGINNCQTVTSITQFETEGDTICISFRDEHGVLVKRCFTLEQINDTINYTDGSCLSSIWGTLTPTEKWQLIIDRACNCCNPTTTTTTTSTTTTTTAAPCVGCPTWTITNVDSTNHMISYGYCYGNNFINELLVPGQTLIFCACYDTISYNNTVFVLTQIADTCIDMVCGSCNKYYVSNNNPFPIEVFWTDCNTHLPLSMWLNSLGRGLVPCACTSSIIAQEGLVIETPMTCEETTTTTTTTTTIPPCRCYSIFNPGGPTRWINYIDCAQVVQGIPIADGETLYLCAEEGSISSFGVIITLISNDCNVGCSALVTTTTTTTTSTTTTTTIAPTTTTTTSTTTTTTNVPQQDIIYFTNHSTLQNRGARIWFSQQDYYTPNTPASVIAANCLSTGDLGVTPSISVTINYWRDDINPSIDDGFAGVRAPDGTKTITIDTDLLTYNISSGAWQRSGSIFTADEGTNIAAFAITSSTVYYTYFGVTHQLLCPPANHYIRVHNTFSAGGTSIIWFDLT